MPTPSGTRTLLPATVDSCSLQRERILRVQKRLLFAAPPRREESTIYYQRYMPLLRTCLTQLVTIFN